MTSNDIRVIVNDEQSFRLYVVNKLGSIETRLDSIEFRVKSLESGQEQTRAEIQAVHDEQIALGAKVDMLLWGAGIIIGAATLAVTIWSIIKPSHKERPESSPTVITIPQPQVDINAIARQLGEMFNLEPKN